jgi:putative transposase
MPNYRRRRFGGLVFLTLVTYGRRRLFERGDARGFLRAAMSLTRQERPWETEAIVLLPDHLHMLWRMPECDTDYSTRISVVKKRFTRAILGGGLQEPVPTAGQVRHRRRAVWQERFWEHTIRDAKDFWFHVEYIHTNPVKHGLVQRPWDWPYSSFKKWVAKGFYDKDWCGRLDLPGYTDYTWPD